MREEPSLSLFEAVMSPGLGPLSPLQKRCSIARSSQARPTLLLDEIDAIFTAKGDENKEALRALLNAGFERRATVPRCVAGPNNTLREFQVFCPKALAGIGKLPDTVADRSIPITMTRRKREEVIKKFRARDAEVIAKPIAAALEAWAIKAANARKVA